MKLGFFWLELNVESINCVENQGKLFFYKIHINLEPVSKHKDRVIKIFDIIRTKQLTISLKAFLQFSC